jgi:hypothetical protein
MSVAITYFYPKGRYDPVIIKIYRAEKNISVTLPIVVFHVSWQNNEHTCLILMLMDKPPGTKSGKVQANLFLLSKIIVIQK